MREGEGAFEFHISTMGCCCSVEIVHPRKQITDAQARIAYHRCKGICFYCKKPLGPMEHRLGKWEVDHSRACALNGESTQDNYYASCFWCNRKKSDSTVRAFLNEAGLS